MKASKVDSDLTPSAADSPIKRHMTLHLPHCVRTAASGVRVTRLVPDVLTNAPTEFFLGDVNRRGMSSF